MSRFFEFAHLTWPEVAELPRATPLVIPLGEGYDRARLAEALREPPRIGLLPPIPFGWRGSGLAVPEPVLAPLLANLVDSVRDDGFSAVYVLTPPGLSLALGAAQLVQPHSSFNQAAPTLPPADAVDKVVLAPIGHTEQHGHHLPLSTDTEIIAAIAHGTVAAAPTRAVTLPPFPYGVSTHRPAFAGTLNCGGRAFEDFWLAVIDVLVRISDMVCELPEIEELDINPLFASPDGVLAVDARIRVSRPPATQGRYEHVAIAPYPRHLIQREVMADGMELVIRPIRPEDAEAERDFVHNLSEQARKFRFMHAMNDLSPAMLARFTHIDYSREMAFVAIAGSGDERKQVGVARYAANPDGKSCEFAVVVSDEMQGRGIGTRLMRALMSEARDRGLTIMEGTVLAENAGMLQLMQSLGFSMRRSPEEPELYLVERWL